MLILHPQSGRSLTVSSSDLHTSQCSGHSGGAGMVLVCNAANIHGAQCIMYTYLKPDPGCRKYGAMYQYFNIQTKAPDVAASLHQDLVQTWPTLYLFMNKVYAVDSSTSLRTNTKTHPSQPTWPGIWLSTGDCIPGCGMRPVTSSILKGTSCFTLWWGWRYCNRFVC